MESDSWSRLSTASGRHHGALQSRFAADLYMGFEEVDGGEDDDSLPEFPCPFCSEDFDIMALCCHIEDEHPVEARNGVCPICEDRVGMDMVGHITMQHENFFKMQRRRRIHKGSSGFHHMLSLLKKELREGHIQALLAGSSYTAPNAAPDPLLSSFIYNIPIVDTVKDVQPQTSDEESAGSKIVDNKVVESMGPTIFDKDHEEKAQRSAFVRELMLSTIFEDRL